MTYSINNHWLLSLSMEYILKNIKEARENIGLTQEQMAEKLDISLVSYGKIERGKTELSIKRLFEIADILKKDPTWLLIDDKSEDGSDYSVPELIEISNKYVERIDKLQDELKRYNDMLTFTTRTANDFIKKCNENIEDEDEKYLLMPMPPKHPYYPT